MSTSISLLSRQALSFYFLLVVGDSEAFSELVGPPYK